jgi:hypothetical protein
MEGFNAISVYRLVEKGSWYILLMHVLSVSECIKLREEGLRKFFVFLDNS